MLTIAHRNGALPALDLADNEVARAKAVEMPISCFGRRYACLPKEAPAEAAYADLRIAGFGDKGYAVFIKNQSVTQLARLHTVAFICSNDQRRQIADNG